ncbi:MAG: glycine--tRNA ligase, partial [Bacteroidetes bacterium SW_10_40_5]
MPKQEDTLKKVISHCKENGYVFQSSEIYDGLSAVYDFGPYGAELKRNIKDYWWKAMVQMHEEIVGLDSAIFMHPRTWEASGHLEQFNDPMIDNKESKKRYRADNLIEDHLEKIDKKIDKEVEQARKKFGDEFDQEHFKQTNPRVQKYQEQRDEIENRLKVAIDNNDLPELKQIIIDLDL